MNRLLVLVALVLLMGCKTDPPAPAPTPTPTEPTPPANAMAPDAGAVPEPDQTQHTPDAENPAIKAASFETWDMAALDACDDKHVTQLRSWMLTHCQAQLAADNLGGRLAGFMDLPKLALPYQAPASQWVFSWNNHSTEVPDGAAIGGRKARFRDNDQDSSFHLMTLRNAAGDPNQVPILAVDGTRPVKEVVQALDSLREAGHTKVSFAFETSAYPLALPPDTTGLDGMIWQTSAPYMREAMKGCDPIGEALEEFSKVPPEVRCGLLTTRIPAAMKACECKMADRHAFLRNLHLFIRPPKFVTAVTVTLGGTPTKVDGDQPWAQAAAALFSVAPSELNLITR